MKLVMDIKKKTISTVWGDDGGNGLKFGRLGGYVKIMVRLSQYGS